MSDLNSKQWYVVYTKPHAEEYTQFHFRLKDVEHFFPQLRLPGTRRKPNRVVPLFPNYMFVRIRLHEDYHRVIWSPGVKYLIGFGGHPVSIEDSLIDFLIQQASPKGIIMARAKLEVGQEVMICGGPFVGLVGIIREPPDAKGRVKLLLNLLRRQVTTQTPLELIESRWVA